jgi:proline dehydrogenase
LFKNAHDSVKADIEFSVKEKFHFGAKLVRGAYLEQERDRARQIGYEDPINKNFQATTDMYEKNVIYCFNQIKKQPSGSIQIMIASHNENTVRFAVQKLGLVYHLLTSNLNYSLFI